MFSVTFVHVLPPSMLMCTSPSSLPAHRTPFCFGDSAMAKMVPENSTVVLSPVMGPPDHCCLLLSSRVRSGLIGFQLMPPSVDLNRTLAAWYTVFESCGEIKIGAVH